MVTTGSVLRFIAFVLCLTFFTCTNIWAADVKVSAEVNVAKAAENTPLEVLVTIVRPSGLDIDLSSFLLDNQPVQVEHLQDARQVSWTSINGKQSQKSLIVSRYRFTIPGVIAGLYVLPPVSVRIGGDPYWSQSSSYEVAKSEGSASFRIQALVVGDNPLYPGQHAKFVYRFFFKDNIDLTVEKLPLLEAPSGFRKIGAKQIKSDIVGGLQVQEISQEVEAMTPGTYHFDPSVIEGYAYQEDFFGRRVYQKPRLRAETDGIDVVVAPFPIEGKPSVFNGAVGTFQIDAKLTSSPDITVGDKLSLEITITGDGQFDSLVLPPLSTQKEFSGRFRFNDLPPTSQVGTGFKRFIVEMRPLSPDLTEIPPIEFSYFDPKSKKYVLVTSKAIPIHLRPLDAIAPPQAASTPMQPATSAPNDKGDKNWREVHSMIGGIEISGNYPLSTNDLSYSWWQTWYVLWILPLGGIVILIQWLAAGAINRRRTHQSPIMGSGDLLAQAMGERDNPTAYFGLVERALILRLKEKKVVAEEVTSAESLGNGGSAGEVRAFLSGLEEQLFTGKLSRINDDVVKQSKQQLERIQ